MNEIIIISLSSLFVIFTFRKWRVHEKYDNQIRLYSKYAPEYCEWCLSFWISLTLTFILSVPFWYCFPATALAFILRSITDR